MILNLVNALVNKTVNLCLVALYSTTLDLTTVYIIKIYNKTSLVSVKYTNTHGLENYSLAPSGLGIILCSFIAIAVLPANFSLPLKNACENNSKH